MFSDKSFLTMNPSALIRASPSAPSRASVLLILILGLVQSLLVMLLFQPQTSLLLPLWPHHFFLFLIELSSTNHTRGQQHIRTRLRKGDTLCRLLHQNHALRLGRVAPRLESTTMLYAPCPSAGDDEISVPCLGP